MNTARPFRSSPLGQPKAPQETQEQLRPLDGAPTAPNETAGYEHLKQKYQQLLQQRQRLSYKLEQAQQEVQKCEDYAKTLGITTLEDFEKHLQEWEAQDKKAIQNFEKELIAEEERQQKTEALLKSLQSS